MDSRHPAHGPYGQPGLEVVNQPDLEVAAQENLQHGESLPQVQYDDYLYTPGGKESSAPTYTPAYPEYYVPAVSQAPHGPAELAATEARGRKKRVWIVVGILVAVLVVVGAVLGGVLGSRAANSSGASAASQTGGGSGDSAGSGDSGGSGGSGGRDPPAGNTTVDAPSDTTAGSQSIRQGSSLSVTGWRKPDGTAETFLFYQDTQDGLRYSKCDTSRRSQSNESACWEAPFNFDTNNAKGGTRFAASTLLYGDGCNPQIELFYVGFRTRLLGVNFNDLRSAYATDDSVNDKEISTGLDSSLTAYWPWTIYQTATGVLYHVRNLLSGGDFAPTSSWDNNKLNTTALQNSRLAIVPMSANFDRIAVKAGYAIFYQDESEKLAVAVTDLDSPQLAKDYPLSWPTAIPDITLPKRAPIAALSVARKNDGRQRVDTYVLYLDANADINVLYSDSTSGPTVQWKTAQPAALKGADPDTDIACLNMATSSYNAAKTMVDLEVASTETRCYFQKGGNVVEVMLVADTGDWVGKGTVPIP